MKGFEFAIRYKTHIRRVLKCYQVRVVATSATWAEWGFSAVSLDLQASCSSLISRSSRQFCPSLLAWILNRRTFQWPCPSPCAVRPACRGACLFAPRACIIAHAAVWHSPLSLKRLFSWFTEPSHGVSHPRLHNVLPVLPVKLPLKELLKKPLAKRGCCSMQALLKLDALSAHPKPRMEEIPDRPTDRNSPTSYYSTFSLLDLIE